MIAFFDDSHHAHAPQFEFFRGERVPCFETPARAEYVKARLNSRGHTLCQARCDSREVLSRVHAPRYLAFLERAAFCCCRPSGHHAGADFMGGYCSEYPFYPGHETGLGVGEGFNDNLPLPAGCTAERWFGARARACQRITRDRGDALAVSLGLDAFAEDPISKFALQADDFARIGERLGSLGLPTVFVLEGGYAASALGTNAVNVIDGFEGV